MRYKSLLVLLLLPSLVLATIRLGGSVSPDPPPTEVTCDLVVSQRIKNIGSYVDGSGMCVMSSIEMAALLQGLEEMRGLRNWCAKQPGGAYPSKVKKQLDQYCKEKGIRLPDYEQFEDVTWKKVADVLKTGRMACVTYCGQDGVRYNGPIAHMVCVVHCDAKKVAILDNNAIGENELLWMTPEEFDQRFRGNQGGWLFYWKTPPPPPIPRN